MFQGMDIHVCAMYAANKFIVLPEDVQSYLRHKVQEWLANFAKILVNSARASNVLFDTACRQGAEMFIKSIFGNEDKTICNALIVIVILHVG